jgi:hypothetical protein
LPDQQVHPITNRVGDCTIIVAITSLVLKILYLKIK